MEVNAVNVDMIRICRLYAFIIPLMIKNMKFLIWREIADSHWREKKPKNVSLFALIATLKYIIQKNNWGNRMVVCYPPSTLERAFPLTSLCRPAVAAVWVTLPVITIPEAFGDSGDEFRC